MVPVMLSARATAETSKSPKNNAKKRVFMCSSYGLIVEPILGKHGLNSA
jgi:hypothetical protein